MWQLFSLFIGFEIQLIFSQHHFEVLHPSFHIKWPCAYGFGTDGVVRQVINFFWQHTEVLHTQNPQKRTKRMCEFNFKCIVINSFVMLYTFQCPQSWRCNFFVFNPVKTVYKITGSDDPRFLITKDFRCMKIDIITQIKEIGFCIFRNLPMGCNIRLYVEFIVKSYKAIKNLIHRPNTSQITCVGRI